MALDNFFKLIEPFLRISGSFNANFYPPLKDRTTIKIVTCCRLEYRRGIDLLLTIIPRFCEQFPYVKFVIAGDGPYRVRLEEIVRRNYLSDRVEIKVTNGEFVVRFLSQIRQ